MPDKPLNQDLISQQYLHKQNEPDLTPYTDIIRSLAPLVNKTSFNPEFEHRTKSIAPELKFLIKMEIKRLAQPCIRSIDLRTIAKDECRLFTYHGISHYLDVNSILCFEHEVNKYSEYTFGVYEVVLEEANNEKQRYLHNLQNPSTSKAGIMLPEEPYLAPCQELLNYPIRKQERLNYVVDIEIFFSDKSSIHANTVDISIHGLRIKLKNKDNAESFKNYSPVKVVFRDTRKHFGWSHEAIEYRVVIIENINDKIQVRLRRESSQNKQFSDFLKTFIQVNKLRYKVNLDNVEMALSSKIYEQSFANNTPTLPVFVNRKDGANYVAEFASTNANNKSILDYWTDENDQQLIGYLVNHFRVNSMNDQGVALPSITVYCFNYVKDEKVYFYSASHSELELYPELASSFLSYASRKASFRIFQLSCVMINPSDAFYPSSVPDSVSKEIDQLNKGITPRLQARLQHLCCMVNVTDITSRNAIKCYQKQVLNKDIIPNFRIFGHARNKLPHLVEACRHKERELRRQSRYILRTPVVIDNHSQLINAVSEDLSVSGLKVQLEEEFNQRAYSKVNVTFPKLQTLSNDYKLEHVTYRVVEVNIDKKVLHLKAISEEEENIAERFFSELISNNLDKLKKISFEESIPGINVALRNMHCKNSPQFCAYIEKQPKGYLPSMSTVNQVKAKWMDFLHHDKRLTTVNLSWLYQDTLQGNSYVNQSLKVLKIDPKPIKTEIFVASSSLESVINTVSRAKWSHELPNNRDKIKFIKQALKLGEFLAFSITINKALTPDMERLEHELMYLSQHAIHKATYFEERMWDIAGVIFINDISDEVIRRYQLDT